jgi:hypothetical protein
MIKGITSIRIQGLSKPVKFLMFLALQRLRGCGDIPVPTSSAIIYHFSEIVSPLSPPVLLQSYTHFFCRTMAIAFHPVQSKFRRLLRPPRRLLLRYQRILSRRDKSASEYLGWIFPDCRVLEPCSSFDTTTILGAPAQPTDILRTKTILLQNCKLLHWKSPHPHVPLAVEQTILEYLFVNSPICEGLLLRDEPNSDSRYVKIKQACRQYNMPLSSALSLRLETVHWKNKNPNLRPAGFDSKVRKSAELFEVAVEQFMLEQLQGQGRGQGGRRSDGDDNDGMPDFWTEDDQREHNKKHSYPPMPTPDILFCESVCCRRYVDSEDEGDEAMEDTDRMDEDSPNRKQVIEEGIIHWCDAKMMYGSSTIPQNNKCAVGKILKTAQKYVKWFGPGALCFMHGCGESLAAELALIGVMALDCSSREAVNIDAVEDHQRTWCGDRNGQIVM